MFQRLQWLIVMALSFTANTSICIIIMCTEEGAFDHKLFFEGTDRWLHHLIICRAKRLRWKGKILEVELHGFCNTVNKLKPEPLIVFIGHLDCGDARVWSDLVDGSWLAARGQSSLFWRTVIAIQRCELRICQSHDRFFIEDVLWPPILLHLLSGLIGLFWTRCGIDHHEWSWLLLLLLLLGQLTFDTQMRRLIATCRLLSGSRLHSEGLSAIIGETVFFWAEMMFKMACSFCRNRFGSSEEGRG